MLDIEWIKDEGEHLYEIAKLCATSDDDLAFLEGKLLEGCVLFSAVASLRKHKLEQETYCFQDFEKDYDKDKRNALQKLFLMPVCAGELKVVDQVIPEKMTLLQLYTEHNNNPCLPLLRLIPR